MIIKSIDGWEFDAKVLTKMGYIEDLGRINSEIYGGGYYDGSCTHQEVTVEEFVAQCTELFGGSFQTLFEKLARRGYKIIKS